MKFVNKKLFLFLIFSLFFVTGFLVFNNLAQAQTSSLDLGLSQAAGTGLASTDIRTIIARIIRAALGLLGIVAVCLVLYAGYLWMTAGGDDEKIGTAKKILVNATIGLVIILSAYSIVSFVMSKLLEATTGSNLALCDQQHANGGDTYGGACPAQPTNICPFGSCDGQFKIVQVPATGNVCIQNVAPVVVFNLDVDIDSLNSNAIVVDSSSVQVAGEWSLQKEHHHIAYFKPTKGTCPAPDTGKDCFAATTTYKIKIDKSGTGIQSADGKKLNCALSAGGCNDIIFTTGDGVDRQNPTISIAFPTLASTDLKQGGNIDVKVNFSDDGGLQNLVLNVDDYLVTSSNFIGCQKSGTATITWPTDKMNIGEHSLKAIGLDWAANSSEGDSKANLKPAHCFNKALNLDLGETFIDCGGQCGVCSGNKCAKNTDCVSGYCEKQNASDPEGVCVDKMRIISFSPTEAAKGDYVSIVGKYFGDNPGKVYFGKVDHPNPIVGADHWVEADVVNCGAGFKNWSDNQIIVAVPAGAVDVVSGTIKVVTANSVFTDTSGNYDGWGDSLPDFKLTNISHPSICLLDKNNGTVGSNFLVKGKNFGIYDAAKSFVTFNDKTKAKIFNNNWTDGIIESVVPTSLGNGDYGVKVTNSNNVTGNSVLFTVYGSNPDAPFISSISAPVTTVIGDYLTITGKNFGNVGSVWFKLVDTGGLKPLDVGNNPDYFNGDLKFPAACKNSVWKDNQIVVKVPPGLNQDGSKYTIQVYNQVSDLNSELDDSKSVAVYAGTPSPGICELSPVSGVVPFAANKEMIVSGEYLSEVSKMYFWKIGGASNDVTNTLAATDVTASADGLSLTTIPSDANIVSGLVYAYRASDKKQSNGLLFSANDCTKNGCASNSDKCCLTGEQAGMCQPTGDLCLGEFKSSGFVWMFSTKEIVEPPQVVERCSTEIDSGSTNKLPTPSPSTKWNGNGFSDASKVCQTALVTVEFSSNLDPKTVTTGTIGTVIVNACDSINVNGICQNPQPVVLTNDSTVLKVASNESPFLSLKASAGKWDKNTLYQVVLKDSITSLPNINKKSLKLAVTNPCGVGTAYCFSFKTGEGDCVLKAVMVTPNNFFAKYLESPMLYHSIGSGNFDVFYNGNGLSNQHCTMMDVSGYNWQWGVKQLDINSKEIVDKKYATIHGAGNTISTQINSMANTVGVGLANDSVLVVATASTSTLSKTGSSPLTIDLSNPEVVEFWPNCLEACTNAAVGVRFNMTMSNFNVTPPASAIKLVRCDDENCFSTSDVVDGNNNSPVVLKSSFDAGSGNTILKIANGAGGEVLLPNTLYQVILSAVSPAGVNGNQLWSASDLADLSMTSKPYNKVFTWRFRTKKEACKVDHIDVLPKVFTASKLKDRAVFQAQPYAAPDVCSLTGQKLNPWTQDWNWTSSVPAVADVYLPFKTKGSSAFCTSNCILKGSTVPSGQASAAYPICGNDVIEAGEDCDHPNITTGCGLNCKFLGNPNATTTISKIDVGLCGDGIVSAKHGEACDVNDPQSKVGCSNFCLHIGSKMQTAAKEVFDSICNNGMIGSGEDCDLGISADQSVSTSSMNCSAQCLHLGTRLSSKWCFDHGANSVPAFGDFQQKDYNFYCNQAYSQCGDGIKSPDEDAGCEFKDGTATGKHQDWCNDRCLKIDKTHPDKTGISCTAVANQEGCDGNDQHSGASLSYAVPSLCGDGLVGIGEDAECELATYLTNPWHKDSKGNLLTDPWVLVIGKDNMGGNVLNAPVPVQETNIIGTIVGKDVNGAGKYQVLCGYKTDEDCQKAYSGEPNAQNVGVGNDSCCYYKTKLTGVYPGNTSTIEGTFTKNVCINTFIEADFDSVIDPATLPGNFVIARSMTSACSGGLEDVSSTISFLASADPSLPWYKNIWKKIIVVVKSIFGYEVDANTWCAGADVGGVEVVKDDVGGSKVLFTLNNPLAPLTEYVVILKKGIKNIQGVSIESKSKDGYCAFNKNLKCSVNSDCGNNKVTIGNKTFSKTKPGICNIKGFGYYFGTINPDGTSNAYDMYGQPLLCNNVDDCINSGGYYDQLVLEGLSGSDAECKSLDSLTPDTNCVVTSEKAIGWRFKTNKDICAITGVTVTPDQYYFSTPNATTSLVAKGVSGDQNNQLIQPVAGYFWNYQWGPINNPYVLVASTTWAINTITSQNNNGEVDVRAAANLTDNKYTKQTGLIGTGKSHIIVFLCENPWPPKHTTVDGQSAIIFPYEDKIGNNDGFDLNSSTFNNKAILPSNVGNGYFNFSTYYCADNGDSGVADDLPYLRPAVQTDVNAFGINVTTSKFITVTTPIPGYCAYDNTKKCSLDADCSYETVHLDCNNDCGFSNDPKTGVRDFTKSTQSGICAIGDPAAPVYSYDGNNNPIMCSQDLDCVAGSFCSDISSFVLPQSSTCLGNTTTTVQSVAGESPNYLKALKRFIFTSDKNSDAIGIQVLANPKHLSLSGWLADQSFDFPPQKLPPIDGYEAVTDGNNIYVSALNFDSPVPVVKGNLYTNVYLFSINNNAAPETRKVFESLVKNLKFNTNLTNYGYCGKDMKNPDNSTVCVSDFDCLSGELCSVQKDKLKRNFQRIQDMGTIDMALYDYQSNHKGVFPDLKEGTYLSGQTISTWPSWSLLSVPSDPINKLGIAGTCSSSTDKFCIDDATCKVKTKSLTETCVLHDPITGWSTADKRFSFACAANSLAYRYMAASTSPATSNYMVKLRMEDSGLIIDNFDVLVSDLVEHPSNFNILNNSLYGICNQNEEIVTINQGTCGDGKVNLNKSEECDPPGTVVWHQSNCAVLGATKNSIMIGDICANNCKWSTASVTTTCGILAKCDNGKVEVGEYCDEGSLNGQYNHCNSTCTGLAASCGDGVVTSTHEVCDTKIGETKGSFYGGWCVGGANDQHMCVNDKDCIDSQAFFSYTSYGVGVCNIQISSTSPKYGLKNTSSCASDCQKYGPYCGDKIVQPEFGEECDGNAPCGINATSNMGAASGSRSCASNCHWQNQSAVIRYNFDNVLIDKNKYKSHIFNSAANTSSIMAAYCDSYANSCPWAVPSVDIGKHNAMQFNGISNFFTVDHSQSIDVNELTIATWIKMDSTTADGVYPIISKEGVNINTLGTRDFTLTIEKYAGKIVNLQFVSTTSLNPPAFLFGFGTAASFINTSSIFNDDDFSWHFVAVTVDNGNPRQGKFYIDGKQFGSGFSNGVQNKNATSSYNLYIGKLDNGIKDYKFFKGSLDEVQLYGRALSDGEVNDLNSNSQNFCEATFTPPTVAVAKSCDNGVVDANEACDNGSKNGIACTPTYNKSCTYCLAGCKNTTKVDATEYCGDGVINGSEKCDISGKDVYSNATGTYNVSSAFGAQLALISKDQNGYRVPACNEEYNIHLNASSTDNFINPAGQWILTNQLGTKSCINNCSSISNNCVECGLQKGGAKVSGYVVDVLDPTSKNPLLATSTGDQLGVVGLVYTKQNENFDMYRDNVAFQQYGDNTDFSHYELKNDPFSGIAATINNNQVCSDNTQPRSYKISLNADIDKAHLIDFPILSNDTPDKYNLFLSPVIDKDLVINPFSEEPKYHLRVVVSWVGDSEEFHAGLLLASSSLFGTDVQVLEDTSLASNVVTGLNYYSKPSGVKNFGIFFHGFYSVDTANVEAFTINTFNMATSAYAFYIHTPSADTPISSLKNSAKLKVDIYMPETVTGPYGWRHFARPVKTYYLDKSLASDNPAAQYWHVFNIEKTISGYDQLASLSNNIDDVNKIITSAKDLQMIYLNP